MSTPTNPPPAPPPPPPRPYGQQPPGQQYGPPQPPPVYAPMPGVPQYAAYPQPLGPPGRMRPTGMTILLFFVTLGIWGFIYYFQSQEEMKRHSGEGLGGVLALLIAIFFGLVSPFVLSHEVGQLYERRGRPR